MRHPLPRQTSNTKTVASTPLDMLETVCDVAREVMGTVIDTEAPLMSAGLDSLSATEFTSTLSERLNIEIEATALFDYPTLQSLADFLSREFSNDVPNRYLARKYNPWLRCGSSTPEKNATSLLPLGISRSPEGSLLHQSCVHSQCAHLPSTRMSHSRDGRLPRLAPDHPLHTDRSCLLTSSLLTTEPLAYLLRRLGRWIRSRVSS